MARPIRRFVVFVALTVIHESLCQGSNNIEDEINGFILDISTSGEPVPHKSILSTIESSNAALRPAELECPSENVITTTYRCQVDNQWTDCNRYSCCPGYTFVAGRCVPDDLNPCNLNLCEQRCSVYFSRVICTCFSGYKFNREKHLASSGSSGVGGSGSASTTTTSASGGPPVQACEDIDECQVNNGDCEQICINEVGSFHCECKPGFRLQSDNQTCIEDNQAAQRGVVDVMTRGANANEGTCSASCTTVVKLRQTVEELTEKVRSLNTAIKLYSFAAAPGPPGPVGPPGPAGPRGFPGSSSMSTAIGPANYGEQYRHPQTTTDEEDEALESEDDVLDSFKMVRRNGKKHFCKCKRGPVGHPGAPGIEGPRGPKGETGVRGEKGEAGSFDFFMLMMADLRHDLEQLQARVYPTRDRQGLPRYNMQQHMAWEERMKQKFSDTGSATLSTNGNTDLRHKNNLASSGQSGSND